MRACHFILISDTSISGMAHAFTYTCASQCAEGLHFSAFHSVCQCVDAYSGSAGYEAAYKRLQNNVSLKTKRVNFLKRLRSRDMP